MMIRTSLRITSAFAILMMVGSSVSTVMAYRWLRQATELERFLIDLQADIFERTHLRDEFLLTRRQQSFQHWMEKSAKTGQRLQVLATMGLPPADAVFLKQINQNFRTTLELFPRIVALRDSTSGAEPRETPTTRIEQRLVDQLLVNAYLLSDSTKLLLFNVRDRTINSQDRLLLLLVLSTLVTGLAVTSSAAYLNHLMSRGLPPLKDGAKAISQGQFDHRIPAQGDDELAELALEVNHMAEELKLSYRRLEVANKELEAFSYSVSHDLRAPLRHLTGFVELLDRRDSSGIDAKSRHYLAVISSSARKMGCLIDDLLSFSRMSRGEMMKQRVDLQWLAQEVIKDLSRDLPAGRPFHWRVEGLPVVVGDQSMLRQVLVNLIGNAIKYTNKVEAPMIEVGIQAGEKDCFTLFVKDNGAGFDMKFVDKLFGLFQRLHSSEEYEGTGVGLANVRRIIGRHGGRTWAEGELDKGATFYFTLPIEKET